MTFVTKFKKMLSWQSVQFVDNMFDKGFLKDFMLAIIMIILIMIGIKL